MQLSTKTEESGVFSSVVRRLTSRRSCLITFPPNQLSLRATRRKMASLPVSLRSHYSPVDDTKWHSQDAQMTTADVTLWMGHFKSKRDYCNHLSVVDISWASFIMLAYYHYNTLVCHTLTQHCKFIFTNLISYKTVYLSKSKRHWNNAA